jgi:hypothetical protein
MMDEIKQRVKERDQAFAAMVEWTKEAETELDFREIRGLSGLPRFYGSSRDPEAEFHLAWDGVAWRLCDGSVPLPQGPRHWWRKVQMMALRFGIRLPVTPPQESIEQWEKGMSASWYTQHHVLEDVGMVFDECPIPTLDEYLRAHERCPLHHEAVRAESGCTVAGCSYGVSAP